MFIFCLPHQNTCNFKKSPEWQIVTLCILGSFKISPGCLIIQSPDIITVYLYGYYIIDDLGTCYVDISWFDKVA